MDLWLHETYVFFFFFSISDPTACQLINPEIQIEPMFITQSEKFRFVAGEDILLPCDVAESGKKKK